MEPSQPVQQSSEQFTPPPINNNQTKSKKNLTIYIVVSIIFAALIGWGVYYWQQNEAKDDKWALEQQITELEQQNDETKKEITGGEQVYENAGLKITLPEGYVVIEKVNGNKGGAPGATFSIGKVSEENSAVVIDHDYYWLTIDVDQGQSGYAKSSAASLAKGLKESGGFENVTIKSEKVAGVDAEVIQATGIYAYSAGGDRKIYFIDSGDFLYEINVNSGGSDIKDFDLLNVVLDNLSITEKKFE